MKKTLSMLVSASASFGFMSASHAQDKASYEATQKSAKAEYKAAREKCDTLKNNAKDICQAEAKAARVKTEANAEASYKGTDKARQKARKDIADADYEVAQAKGDDLTGNQKEVCEKEAKAVKAAG